MIEKIYLGSILLVFILAFTIRNIKTASATGLAIKGKSRRVNLSILFSTLIYLGIILRLTVLSSTAFYEFHLADNQLIKYPAFVFVTMGFIIGMAALFTMRNSWRVGIRYDQKTELVTNGIYKFSRNPYFLSYYLIILGFVLIFPSPFIIVPYFLVIVLFHSMILEEEKYLENTHGEAYFNYKKKVNRYISLI